MKQKVKSAPKELVRRGLDDGTERLRGQLRDAAQRGQTDDYGGDRIEDAAVSGVRRTERGIESLLKHRKKANGRIPDGDPLPPADPPAAQEPPADLSPQEPPRIKTRETVAARESGTVPSAGGITEPTPEAGAERQRIKMRESTVRDTHMDTPLTPQDRTEVSSRIKTRESTVHDSSVRGESVLQAGPKRPQIRTRETAVRDLHTDMGASPRTPPEAPRIKTRESVAYDPPVGGDPAPQAGPDRPQIRTKETAAHDFRVNVGAEPQAASEPPQIKTKGAVTGVLPDHTAAITPSNGERPPDRLQIKTKDICIQQHTVPQEQPSHTFAQGQQDFMQEQGRRAAVKRAEVRRTGNGVVPQTRGGTDMAPSVPAQHGYPSSGRGFAPIHSAHQPVSLGSPDAHPVRDGGKATIKTARSTKKASERTARHAIKTAERSSRRAVKTTQRTAKTTAQTVRNAHKTAQATAKAAQRTVQAARATAKAAATTAKATAKATVAAIKAAIATIQALAAVVAAGGWVAVVIILILCLVGLLIASPFGVFFLGDGSTAADAPSAVMAQINQEYADALASLQAGGSYDSVEIIGRPPSWANVFAVFAVKTVSGDGVDVVVLDEDRVERLRTVFWDMIKITTETKTVEHPATDDEDAWTETVLVITVTPRTTDDKLGTLTHVGLNTFADPRIEGGKLNEVTKEDIVEVVEVLGEERLLYKARPIDIAFIRGSTADESGNVSLERECCTPEATAIAQACKNSGGKVVVQVEKVVQDGCVDPRLVKIPGIYVDAIVVCHNKEDHAQCQGCEYDGSMTGDYRVPLGSLEYPPMSAKKIIGRRAAMELEPDKVVNLGIGIPEYISMVANEEGIGHYMTLTVEAGPVGGVPQGGPRFGGAVNVECILDQPTQFDFYDGGGVDLAFLGLAQADKDGNINVSKFGPRIAGCGGFVNITQNAKKVYFCGTFTAGGFKSHVADGKLIIDQEGRERKLVDAVEQITFSGKYAVKTNQPVMYITERAVFELRPDGMYLTEVAPGIDVKTQILDLMGFEPKMEAGGPKLMDARIFRDDLMGLKD